jgi:Fe-S cluster biogenesis protein NfuA
MSDEPDTLRKALCEILVPLVEQEGGQLHLVTDEAERVVLHLAGSLSGSPAAPVVKRRIIEPAVRAVRPNATIEISSGWTVPEGAERLSSEPSGSE